jgi:hypothetical protein
LPAQRPDTRAVRQTPAHKPRYKGGTALPAQRPDTRAVRHCQRNAPIQGRCGKHQRISPDTRVWQLTRPNDRIIKQLSHIYAQNKFCCYRENVLKYVGNTPNTSAKAMTNTSSPDTRAVRQTPAHKPRYKGGTALPAQRPDTRAVRQIPAQRPDTRAVRHCQRNAPIQWYGN